LKSDSTYRLLVVVAVLVHREASAEQLADTKRFLVHSRSDKLLHFYDLKGLASGHLAEQLEKIFTQDSQRDVQLEYGQIGFDSDRV